VPDHGDAFSIFDAERNVAKRVEFLGPVGLEHMFDAVAQE
jgi:hypothetical protein